jgi:hypothetical protein
VNTEQVGKESHRVVRPCRCFLKQRVKFVEPGLWGVILCKSRRPLELRDEGEERAIGVMWRARVAKHRFRLPLKPLAERKHQTRLANAGFA